MKRKPGRPAAKQNLLDGLLVCGNTGGPFRFHHNSSGSGLRYLNLMSKLAGTSFRYDVLERSVLIFLSSLNPLGEFRSSGRSWDENKKYVPDGDLPCTIEHLHKLVREVEAGGENLWEARWKLKNAIDGYVTRIIVWIEKAGMVRIAVCQVMFVNGTTRLFACTTARGEVPQLLINGERIGETSGVLGSMFWKLATVDGEWDLERHARANVAFHFMLENVRAQMRLNRTAAGMKKAWAKLYGGYDDRYCYQPLNSALRVRFRHWADRRADYSMNVDGRRKAVRPLIPSASSVETATGPKQAAPPHPLPPLIERFPAVGPVAEIEGQPKKVRPLLPVSNVIPPVARSDKFPDRK